MGATDREFQAQSGFIAACDDPNTLLDWMREYRDSERAAVGRGDEDEARQMDDLAELAEDRAIELKAAQIIAARPNPRVPETQRAAPALAPVAVDDSAAELRKVKEELAASREAQARAERERVAAVERAEQRERDAVAAKVAAESAATAPPVNATPVVAQNRPPEREAQRERVRENERLRLAAARELAASNRTPAPRPPAATLPAPGRSPTPAQAMTPVRTVAPQPIRPAASAAQAPMGARPVSPPAVRARDLPAEPLAELTPLAQLFQQRLTEIMPLKPTPPPTPPPTRPPPPPAPPARVLPPVDPVDELPQLTGADLTSYRTWLDVSQRALATKFKVEQSVISKSEGKPTTVLPPQLRKALHEAMSEPRQDVGGAQ